jgi:hypothetical protein
MGSAARTLIFVTTCGAGVVATAHVMPLDDAPQGYQIFKDKKDNCVRPVFLPN